jgi:membrane protease YdiL (CAAX protease family)
VTAPPALHELLFAALLAAGVAAGAMPHLHARVSLPGALALGAAVGVALAQALAGRPIRPRLRRPRAAAGPLLLAGRAGLEEVAWRGFLLGALVPAVGPAAATAASSVVFACAHPVRRRADRLVHVLTGAAFGLVYVASGRLLAAVAAHVAYNALLAAAAPRGVASA